MRIKRLALSAVGVALLAGTAASSAGATATTGGEWYVNGSTLTAGTHESVECEIGEHPTGEKKFVLTGSVGVTETPIKLTATGVDCVEASIFNDASPAVGTDEGTLTFTGVTVSEPANCEVEGGMVTTNPLHTELYYDATEPTIAFDKFEPASGFTNFANVKIIGNTCSITGTKVTKGSVFGQAVNPTGTAAVKQGLTFSSSIDSTAGSALEFAGHPAHLTGQVENSLSGANKGKEWYAKK